MASRSKRPAYGLVCQTSDDRIRFRTITRTRLLALDAAARRERLRELYADNIGRLHAAVRYCAEHDIRLFRVPTGLLPFSDHDAGSGIPQEFRSELSAIGVEAAAQNVRLISHPDQFVVLNSESEAVRMNSVRVLEAEAQLFDLLGLPQSAWAAINVHGGKGGRARELVHEIGQLPDAIRLRLTLENDERVYGAPEIHAICAQAGIPMIFDAHHHLVKERLESYDDLSIGRWTRAAAASWPDPSWQIVHVSNGRDHLHDPRHSDFIDVMPKAFARVPYVEIEAKQKERALFALQSR